MRLVRLHSTTLYRRLKSIRLEYAHCKSILLLSFRSDSLVCVFIYFHVIYYSNCSCILSRTNTSSMVTEGECSCTDTTEPSNVTSLHSDIASAENLNPNADKIIDKEVDNIEEPRESTHLFSYERNGELTISIAYPFLMAVKFRIDFFRDRNTKKKSSSSSPHLCLVPICISL